MSRLAAFVALSLVVVLGVGAYGYAEVRRADRIRGSGPTVAETSDIDRSAGGRIVFRHTGLDEQYGTLAEVSLAAPGGPRAFTEVVCDRVYARAEVTSCLVTDRGVVTRYRLDELAPDGSLLHREDLPGIPSRTRLSPEGSLVATTTFVSGHSYEQTGFSTATEIRAVDGPTHGDLEKFRLSIDGKEVAPVDRNVWGVTFVDDTRFYATVSTGGRTYLVDGDLGSRTLTSVRENAECPSISPDGTRVAYKVTGDGDPHWSFAVLDLATGEQTILAGEHRNVDDQAEWLDEDTLLYGMPRADEPGVTDVWAIDTRADARPELLIEQAWSPSVVRP